MTTIVDAPTRADDLQLLGAMVGSGYRTPPALVRRGDGQTLQLTPLLYAVLDAADGRRTTAQIAAVVRDAMRREVSAAMVETLVEDHLRPMGLLKLADGSEPAVKRANPLLALRLKYAATDPATTRRLTDPFRILFRPAVVAVVVMGFLAITWWVFFQQGLAPAAYDAFHRPQLLLLVFVVTVLSGGFHEFGHAAAARYGGASPGVIGAGIYLVWPAFYTDVTDSYRLGRRGRVRTDLGGLYFNAIVVVLTFGWWYATGWDAVLLLVATQTLQMVQQLMPMLRFDGYHLLADLTGVPDLYHRIRPTLVGLLPHRWSDPHNRVLKPWARAVITAWVLVTIPMMAFMLLAMVTALPRLLGTAWASMHQRAAGVLDAWQAGQPVDVVANALQVLAVALPVLGGLLILGRLSVRWSRGLTRWSQGSLGRRATAVALVSVVVTALAWAWAPRPGNYRPITPADKGLLTAVLPVAQNARGAVDVSGPAATARPIVGTSAEHRLSDATPMPATFQAGQALPTKAHPQLALVLVPADGAGQDATPNPNAGDSAQPWVFPFSQPLPPAEGDNQALAVNTTDDTTTYDVAFALVWATGNEVLNVNEAHAYASCSNCVTVAVAFQVVLIMDDAQVVVPQNLAVAANYDCYRCITAALASQLVLSVTKAPGEEQLLALGEVWSELLEFGNTITSYSLSEISTRLDGFKADIVAILGDAPPAQPGTAATPTPSATGGPTTSAAEPSSSSPPGASSSPAADPAGSPASSPGTSSDDPPSSSDSPAEPAGPTSEPTAGPTSDTAPETAGGQTDPATGSVAPSTP